MIGLPTITTSRTRSRRTIPAGEQLADQLVERLADGGGELPITAGVHHHVRHAAHQVLAEADLRVHPSAAGDDVAAEQRTDVAGDRRRADVDGDAVGLVDEAGPDGDDPTVAESPRSPCRRRSPRGARGSTRRRGRSTTSPCCSATAAITRSAADRPEPSSCRQRPRRSAGRTTGRRRAGAVEVAKVLADDLAVHLARRRHVDDDVGADRRGAAEAVPGGERAVAAIVPLERRPPVELVAGGRDLPLGERADRRDDLAAPADAPPATHAVEVDAERGGRRRARSCRRPTSPDEPRRREHHPVSCVVAHHRFSRHV